MSTPTFRREPIMQALFALLSALTWTDGVSGTAGYTWVTKSRRIKLFNDVDTAQMPSLFLAQCRETHEPMPGMGSKITIQVEVHVYVCSPEGVDSSGNEYSPGQILNPILDAINSIVPTAGKTDPGSGKQTLGGLVQHVVIKGDIQTAEGTLGNKELSLIPIEILVVS